MSQVFSPTSLPAPGHRTVAVLQSNYIPWKGYFDIVHDVDLFIFYDDVQYTKNDWRNRNRVKTANGTEWLTIPTGDNSKRLICEVDITAAHWQTKHWKTIQQCYGRCPHFARYAPFFEELYLGCRWTSLSALNQHVIQLISREFLGITTEFKDSREFASDGRKLDRLLDLVTRTGAHRYISGPAARDYIDPSLFAAKGIELVWKDYSGYPEAPQRFPPFRHDVSIVDLLFNVGPNAPWYIWGWRNDTRPGQASDGSSPMSI
jgi:hypothetical protein